MDLILLTRQVMAMTNEFDRNVGPQRQREVFFKALGDPSSVIPTEFSALREQARATMDEGPFGYVAGNASSETTARDNRRAFDEWRILPRVLTGIEDRRIETTLFEQRQQAPLLPAPVGVQSIIHEEGARASARAADAVGLPFVHSTVSSFTIEAIADATEGLDPWFQLYWSDLPDLNRSLINRAEKAGYRVLVVTLDTPLMGWRPRDLDRGYLPFLEGEGLANYTSDPVFQEHLPGPPDDHPDEVVELFLDVFSDTSVGWEDLANLVETTDLPVLVKGVLHPDDARKALDHDADGIIVSNHGGRQIDGGLPALEALPSVSSTVPDDTPLFFDSGIRSGSDVYKALALGADSVLLGRPYLYGLGINGQAGVESVLRNILAELDITMGLSGYDDVRDVDEDSLVPRS